MMPGSKRRTILGASVGAVVVAAIIMTGNDDPAPAGGRTAAQNRRTSNRAPDQSVPVSELKLELLRRSAPEADQPGRNPFRFEGRPTTAAAAPTPSPAPAAPSVPAGRGVTAPPPAAVKPGPLAIPPIPLRYIGLVDAPSQAGRVAVLSDGRGNVFQGKEGDTIEGRYRVVKVGPDTVEVAYVDGRGPQTIRLSGQ